MTEPVLGPSREASITAANINNGYAAIADEMLSVNDYLQIRIQSSTLGESIIPILATSTEMKNALKTFLTAVRAEYEMKTKECLGQALEAVRYK